MTALASPPASTSLDVSSPREETASSPADIRSLMDFLEDISIAFEVLYENGDITATEYLASTLGQFDDFLGNGEGRGPSPRT